MDQRKSLQILMNRGRHHLSECHSMSRRLDGIKGILFMKRDVACETVQKHISMLTSHLANILDQHLVDIEQVCQEREMTLYEEKTKVFKKMSALTNMCGQANEFLQLGKEDLCGTTDCESLIQDLHQMLQTNIEISCHDQYINLKYEPLLLDNSLQLNSVGMLKTSHLDPREIEIKHSNDKDRNVMIVTKGQNLCEKDLVDFKVKLVDNNGDNKPIDLLICTSRPWTVQVVFGNKQDEMYHLEVKVHGIHVVNSPFKYKADTGIDNDSSYVSESSSYNLSSMASSTENSSPESTSSGSARKLNPEVHVETKLQSTADTREHSSEAVSDSASANCKNSVSLTSKQDTAAGGMKEPVISSKGKNRESRGYSMPRAPLASNRKRLGLKQKSYYGDVSKSNTCKTDDMKIRNSMDICDSKSFKDISKTRDASRAVERHGVNHVQDVSECQPKCKQMADKVVKNATVSNCQIELSKEMPAEVEELKVQSEIRKCSVKGNNAIGCKQIDKNDDKSDMSATVIDSQQKVEKSVPPGAYQPKVPSKCNQIESETRNHNHSPNYQSLPYCTHAPYTVVPYGPHLFYPNSYCPYKPQGLRRPYNYTPKPSQHVNHKQVHRKSTSPEGGRVKLKLGFPHTCRQGLNINTVDK